MPAARRITAARAITLRFWRFWSFAVCAGFSPAAGMWVIRAGGGIGASKETVEETAWMASGAVAKRPDGSLSRQWRIADSQRGSRSGTWIRGVGGASRNRRMATEMAVSPVNGTTPVIIS
jgi:hypothetical protein